MISPPLGVRTADVPSAPSPLRDTSNDGMSGFLVAILNVALLIPADVGLKVAMYVQLSRGGIENSGYPHGFEIPGTTMNMEESGSVSQRDNCL
jgi:hypothetical protein